MKFFILLPITSAVRYNTSMFGFIDDAGDPGFRIEKGLSKIFIIALVLFQDDLAVDMVAGIIYSSYTEKDSSYLNKLKENNKIEDIWEY